MNRRLNKSVRFEGGGSSGASEGDEEREKSDLEIRREAYIAHIRDIKASSPSYEEFLERMKQMVAQDPVQRRHFLDNYQFNGAVIDEFDSPSDCQAIISKAMMCDTDYGKAISEQQRITISGLRDRFAEGIRFKDEKDAA